MELTELFKQTANAIREKKGTTNLINATDFPSEIISIEGGLDTSDATATANDILGSKTAYVNGEKIVGNIKTTEAYGGDITYSEISSVVGDISLRPTTKILPDGNRLCIVGGNINVYDDNMNLLNSYSLSSFGISIDSATNTIDASSLYDETNSLLVALTHASGTYSGATMTVSFFYYNNGELGLINHDGQTVAYNTITVSSQYSFFAVKWCNTRNSFILSSRGYGVYYVNINNDLSYNTEIISTSANLTRVYLSDLTSDDKWLILNHDLPWDGATNVLVSLVNNTVILNEDIHTDMIFVDDTHIVIKDDYYRLDNATNSVALVKSGLTGLLSTGTGYVGVISNGYYKGAYNKNLLAVSNNTTTITLFAITDIEQGTLVKLVDIDKSSGNNVCTYKTLEGLCLAINGNVGTDVVGVFDISTIMTAEIYGSKLYNTADAEVTSDKIVSGEIAFNKEGKIIGSMINNGVLNYTPSDTEQTIPTGYTSGGTINAVDITVLSDYKACKALTEEILGIEPEEEPVFFEEYVNFDGNTRAVLDVTAVSDYKYVLKFGTNASQYKRYEQFIGFDGAYGYLARNGSGDQFLLNGVSVNNMTIPIAAEEREFSYTFSGSSKLVLGACASDPSFNGMFDFYYLKVYDSSNNLINEIRPASISIYGERKLIDMVSGNIISY